MARAPAKKAAVKPKRAPSPESKVEVVDAGGCAPPVVVADDISALPACTQAVVKAQQESK